MSCVCRSGIRLQAAAWQVASSGSEEMESQLPRTLSPAHRVSIGLLQAPTLSNAAGDPFLLRCFGEPPPAPSSAAEALPEFALAAPFGLHGNLPAQLSPEGRMSRSPDWSVSEAGFDRDAALMLIAQWFSPNLWHTKHDLVRMYNAEKLLALECSESNFASMLPTSKPLVREAHEAEVRSKAAALFFGAMPDYECGDDELAELLLDAGPNSRS